jgi:flagellar hook assembly protein FlgD
VGRCAAWHTGVDGDSGTPTASVETIGPFEISPAASAGEQDVYRGRVTVASDQRVEIDQLGVYVSDSAGNDVYNYVLDEPTARDSLPKRTGWGGTNDVGNYVPDGTYTLRVEVIDSVGQRARSNLEPVVVDNTPPQVTLRSQYTIFSPDGDGNRDSIRLDHQVDGADQQIGEILNEDDEPVRSWEWDGQQPGTVTWDGRDSAGERVNDGRYRYVYTVQDDAGNTATARLENLRVSTDQFSATLERAVPAFSPNGNGVRDVAAYRVSFQNPDRITGWTLSFNDTDGETLAEQTGEGAPSERLTFDGRGDGETLAEGEYVATIRATYRNGDVATATASPVILDLEAPSVEVSAQSERFSPEADDGTLAITHNASSGSFWEGAIIPSDSDQAILTVEWENQVPGQFEWNGQTNSGEPAAGGEYTYRLTGRDVAGNAASDATVAFTLDRAGPDVSAKISPQPFTPDGDGNNDELSIGISSSDRTGIASWSLAMRGPTGSEFYTRSGEGTPPQMISWDGTGNDGSLVQSARDYTAVISLTDEAGNSSATERNVSVGILVDEEASGDLRVGVSGIVFAPFEDDYRDLRDPAREERNERTLDRVAGILSAYPERNIRVEGHAVHLFVDEERREIEQQETLLPLSRERAEAIRDALIDRGISSDRLTIAGRGGSEPLVPHTNEEDRWRNRRVEFELTEG